MSTHGPMPRSAWIFPALSALLFAGATALGYSFAPSAAGLAFAAVLLVITAPHRENPRVVMATRAKAAEATEDAAF